MDGSSTRRCPLPWLVSGRKIAMKLDESGQAVANSREWDIPSETGKASATTQAMLVTARERSSATAAMSLSTA